MLWTQKRRANEKWLSDWIFLPSDIHSVVCSVVVIGIGEVPLTWENTNEEEFWRKKRKQINNGKLTNLVPMGSSRPWAHHTLPHAASTRLPRTWKWWINYKRNLVGFPNWHVSGCQEQVGLGTRLEKSCSNHHQQHKIGSYHSVDQFSHHWQRKLRCCHSPAWSSRWNHEWTLSSA